MADENEGVKPPPVEKPAEETFTRADLERSVAEARAEVKRAADEAKAKEQEERERAEAEKRGEFQKVAEQEQAKREQAEAKAIDSDKRAQRAEVKAQLQDYLAEKHSDYIGKPAGYIMNAIEKHLTLDLKPDAIDKIIADESSAYVEANPREKKTGGTPPSLGRGQGNPPPRTNADSRTTRRPYSGMAYRG